MWTYNCMYRDKVHWWVTLVIVYNLYTIVDNCAQVSTVILFRGGTQPRMKQFRWNLLLRAASTKWHLNGTIQIELIIFLRSLPVTEKEREREHNKWNIFRVDVMSRALTQSITQFTNGRQRKSCERFLPGKGSARSIAYTVSPSRADFYSAYQ